MKTGFVTGTFDLLHAGHVFFLAQARDACEKLIVGLQTDPTINRKGKNKPVQSTFERWYQLTGCSFVDRIIPYDTEEDLINILETIPMDIRFLGSEYKTLPITGLDICNRRKIEIAYIDRYHNYSSSELRKRVARKESF